ncbi:dTMP kinase [Candidatus Shapirobacteria bacterium CG10_big_fil_rev_8_21_14_0_10_38_14]|uniref:Thymidylate kinase n=1 Tax=Candidatus Shapirobacteria bacterium CG10_big_fil_rev_8_21_14_0_10_38_14 TaxID=1974483 RepID=A0A2M8L699_9BACT|nr:MAG: dTMP kinase [Candidatus Shapirobacteria bacterium CG10_big_fil_rev_8_21_14_0_10_38_14]
MNKGFYIAFEGIEGCGKSTQSELLVAKLRQEFSEQEIVLTREPGGTEISEAIRNVLLNPKISSHQMEPLVEVYLFAAARAQSLREVIKPALERGAVVIADRSIYSSLAYQAFGRELGVDRIWEINLPAIGRTLPDLVILPDIFVETGFARISNQEKDRMEQEKLEFHQKVREGYLFLAQQDENRFLVIDGSLPIETQAELIWERVRTLIPNDEVRRELQIRKERE